MQASAYSSTARQALLLTGLTLLAACAAPPSPSQSPAAPAIATPPPSSPAVRPRAPDPVPPPPRTVARPPVTKPTASVQDAAAPVEALGTAFATKYARFEPAAFTTLPGWSKDSIRDSMEAFRQSCLALGKKPVWNELCQAAEKIDARNDNLTRAFFEQQFYAYSVLNPDQTDEGVITGYYEPLLEGSRTRSSRYPYPVHGIPADLLFIDARTVAADSRPWLRLNERRLEPAAANTPGARQYELGLNGMTAGIRDKRYRVRIEGRRIVPYWTRQDIERRVLDAQALAWVNDAYALYSMQIQGSGKIRMAGGETIRVAYGEQNGHPFLPQASSSDTIAVGSAIKTRGLKLGGASAAATSAAAATPVAAAPAPSTQRDPEVARLIAALQGTRPAPAQAPAATSKPLTAPPILAPAAPASSASVPPRNAEVAAIIAALSGKGPPPATPVLSARQSDEAIPVAVANSGAGATGTVTGIPDPSYVFFRLIPDSAQGPLGALGVPLTAGRSIAVDPRTTPLGYPVFVSTGESGTSNPALNRLMFAQDTGGAIRGSVRADYFWGFGPSAGNSAARMKETGRMWLLLPRDLQASAVTAAIRTRSVGGGGPLPECVVADIDNCVEE